MDNKIEDLSRKQQAALGTHYFKQGYEYNKNWPRAVRDAYSLAKIQRDDEMLLKCIIELQKAGEAGRINVTFQ